MARPLIQLALDSLDNEVTFKLANAAAPYVDILEIGTPNIKANGLQDAANKRAINADAKLREVFGKEQITMFELAGIVGKHLG